MPCAYFESVEHFQHTFYLLMQYLSGIICKEINEVILIIDSHLLIIYGSNAQLQFTLRIK